MLSGTLTISSVVSILYACLRDSQKYLSSNILKGGYTHRLRSSAASPLHPARKTSSPCTSCLLILWNNPSTEHGAEGSNISLFALENLNVKNDKKSLDFLIFKYSYIIHWNTYHELDPSHLFYCVWNIPQKGKAYQDKNGKYLWSERTYHVMEKMR